MTPELRKIQIEEIRDEIEQFRTALIEPYKVRKWLDCERITENRLNDLVDLIEGEFPKKFRGQLKAHYRAKPNFGVVIVQAPCETVISGKTYNERNPPPKPERPANHISIFSGIKLS